MDPGYLCMLGQMDVFATYLQRLPRIVGWDDAGISGGKERGMEKLVIVAILHTESLDRKQATALFISMMFTCVYIFIIVRAEEFSLVNFCQLN